MSKAKKMIRTEFRGSLTNYRDSANQMKRDAQILKDHRAEVIHVADTLFDYLGTNSTDLDAPRVYCYFTVTSQRPVIHLSIHDADGFKDDSLSMAMMHLMTVGFESKGTNESAEYLNRIYKFDRADMRVDINVYVRSDSPTCRKVAVGEKMVKEVQYKIECD